MIIGGILTLFVPGYGLVNIFYPDKKEVDHLQNIGLSLGLSVVIVIFVGLILNFTVFGISLLPILCSINILSLIFIVIAFILRVRLAISKHS